MIIVTTKTETHFLNEKDFTEITYNSMSQELTWTKTIHGVVSVRKVTDKENRDALRKHADGIQRIIDYMRKQRATQTKIIEDIYQISTSKDVNHKTAREHITKLCEKCISECEETYNEAKKNGIL